MLATTMSLLFLLHLNHNLECRILQKLIQCTEESRKKNHVQKGTLHGKRKEKVRSYFSRLAGQPINCLFNSCPTIYDFNLNFSIHFKLSHHFYLFIFWGGGGGAFQADFLPKPGRCQGIGT